MNGAITNFDAMFPGMDLSPLTEPVTWIAAVVIFGLLIACAKAKG